MLVDLPQESCMAREFARLVSGIKDFSSKPHKGWLDIMKRIHMNFLYCVKKSYSDISTTKIVEDISNS